MSMEKAKYELRLMFEWGAIDELSIIWGMNEEAKETYGYNIRLSKLPISSELSEELMRLHEWHDDALDWDDPASGIKWPKEEVDKFIAAANEALLKLQDELGSEYHVYFSECIDK